LNKHVSFEETNSLLTHLFLMHIFPIPHVVPSAPAEVPIAKQDVPFEFTHQSEVQIDDNCLYYINNNKNNFVLYLD
jgi:hypothetical protein